ncbi:hypothetical protein HPB50_015255 [Hyalomma asiaticum]|uniref:Uncharacterized protein n=1 Tax=Hyalomma asiaticum TaxID=266040 RepID=A0ACB7RJJ5_HYAAI|nr:hypothetical protein HPB50_015255 [Hyalomma asiaticum]
MPPFHSRTPIPRTPIPERVQIVTLSVAGLPQRQIADATRRPRSLFDKIVQDFSKEAQLTNLSRVHRPKVATDSDDKWIVEAARQSETRPEDDGEKNMQQPRARSQHASRARAPPHRWPS